jgi:hypothetical protein
VKTRCSLLLFRCLTLLAKPLTVIILCCNDGLLLYNPEDIYNGRVDPVKENSWSKKKLLIVVQRVRIQIEEYYIQPI